MSANWVCSACAGLSFGFEHKEHGLIFELSLVWKKRYEMGNFYLLKTALGSVAGTGLRYFNQMKTSR